MQQFYFEYSALLIIPCLLLAAGAAWYLYQPEPPWGKKINLALTGLRFCSVFILLLLLLGPVIKLVLNQTDKPLMVVLFDQSRSVSLRDSTQALKILDDLNNFQEDAKEVGYAVEIRGLDGKSNPSSLNGSTSDISGSIRKAELDFEDSNLSAVLLISDGIFNSGVSPLYSTSSVPVHTIGVGDTVQQRDIRIKQLSYNKVTFQGNKFPVRAEIITNGFDDEAGIIQVTASTGGKKLQQQDLRVGRQAYQVIDFLLEAAQPGIIRIDITAESLKGEFNRLNNKMSAVIEVVDSKKQILMVSSAPHPDIKALRSAIEKNEHYTVSVLVPGVMDLNPPLPASYKPDVIIFNQIPNARNTATDLLQKAVKEKIPSIYLIGQQSALRQLPGFGIPVTFESTNQWDEVNAVSAAEFRIFKIPDQQLEVLNRMPPVLTPFGKLTVPADKQPIWVQRIGNVVTDRPLLFTLERDDRRMAVLLAEGVWRWRMKEFQLTQKTIFFDELFSKLIQYLSTAEDKRKFRCFPLEKNFPASQPALLEAQIFNEVFEPEYGLPVQLEITDEKGEKQKLTFTPEPTKTRFAVPLPDGVYRYKASIERNGKTETDNGSFSVSPGDAESQDLTADFQLLRQLSVNTGGRFEKIENWGQMKSWLLKNIPPSSVRSDESFYPAIDLLWIFFLVLVMLTTEWVVRRSYQ